jgi:hypothetical protein
MEVIMREYEYGDYPETSVAWWEESDAPVYKDIEEFEWDLVDEDEQTE